MVSAIIVDDDALFRVGLQMILETQTGVSVLGEAADGEAAVDLVRQRAHEIDVVLMDLNMPGLGGLEATRQIVQEFDTRVLILTTYTESGEASAAIEAGASGFLLKDIEPAALGAAIVSASNGTAVVSPEITRQIVMDRTVRGLTAQQRRKVDSLTERETEVLRLMARGLNNDEIGSELYISDVTVKTHVGRVLRKLSLRDRIQAVVFAYDHGMVTAGRVLDAATA